MTYELAKQLKNAGFKGNTEGMYISPEGFEICNCGVAQGESQGAETNDVPLPTLSELIEACGKNLGSVIRLNDDLWVCHPSWKIERVQGIITGSTPEEAVARLWLELNK